MEVPVWLGPQKSGDDEVGVAGKGVRLLDGGGDGMEGVLSIDDNTKPSYPIGGAACDNGVLKHSFLVFLS